MMTVVACGTSWRVAMQDLFANQFGGEKARRLIGNVVGREVFRAFGQAADDFVAQLSRPSSLSAEIGRYSAKSKCFCTPPERQQIVLRAQRIDFVEDRE